MKYKQDVNKIYKEVKTSKYFSQKNTEKEVLQVLKLLVTDADICRISKELSNMKLETSITKSTIIIYADEISDEAANILVKNATIISAQNYHMADSDTKIKVDTFAGDSEAYEFEDEWESIIGDEEDELILERTCRGQVYRWIPDRIGNRKGIECAIIIQNYYKKNEPNDTIALLCTAYRQESLPIRFSFLLNESNVLDYKSKRLKNLNNCIFFISQIKQIDKNRLGSYLGTMTNEFMNTLQPSIDFYLSLKSCRTFDWTQLQILSTVNIEELLKISESKISDEEKVDNFLKLFGFDILENGMDYVKDSILIAHEFGNPSLEPIARTIAKRKNIKADDVLRKIVARTKKILHFKKSPAISFIRLIEGLLRKG